MIVCVCVCVCVFVCVCLCERVAENERGCVCETCVGVLWWAKGFINA